MKSRIYLIGFMGVGKSTIGKKLAKALKYNFIDLDSLFEKKYKLNINLFFTKYDEKLFRKLETKLLDDTFNVENTVIATGGGTACHYEGINKINKHGLSIYLKMKPASIVYRLSNAKRLRPLIQDKKEHELINYIETELEQRIPFYEKAHLTFDVINIDMDKLIKTIKKY